MHCFHREDDQIDWKGELDESQDGSRHEENGWRIKVIAMRWKEGYKCKTITGTKS
jgi:hypothetical protein